LKAEMDKKKEKGKRVQGSLKVYPFIFYPFSFIPFREETETTIFK